MDEALSRRAQRTGIVGALTALSLFASYAWFGREQLPGYGPTVHNYARVLPIHSEHVRVARDFFDVIAILVFTYLVMACVDRFREKSFVMGSLSTSACVVLATWLLALGHWPIAPNTFSYLGAEVLTQYEIVLLLGALSIGVVPFVYLVRHRRHWLSRANLGKGLWRGFNRWLVGYLTLWFLGLVFLTHPYLKSTFYANARLAFGWVLLGHVFLGLPYALLTNWLRYSLPEHRRDPSIGLLVCYRRVLAALTSGSMTPISRALATPWLRSNLLDLFCVKFFFLPIMLCFLFSEGGAYFGAIHRIQEVFDGKGSVHWNAALYTAGLRAILLTDVAIGVIGYAGTSRWLYNKSKSVDPSMSGWVWALLCYPPFNHASGELFPFHSNLGTPYFSAPWLADFCGAVMLVCFAIYAWATVSFGVRFSNMTHRGIICHGPYAIVRHPAYISKGIAWLAELLPKLANPWQVIGLVLFTGVYGLRGLTEEWHLRKDPSYREYCRRVPYRFVPGLF